MKLISIILVIFSFTFAQQSLAGLDSYESKNHKFKYDVKSEIKVKPDKAVFPIIITVESSSYKKSLEKANKVVKSLELTAKKLNNEIFAISPADFFKKHRRDKFSSVSFFGGDKKGKASTKLVAFLTVSFSQEHGFDQRANFIAESLDFVSDFRNEYKSNDDIIVYPEESFFVISNIEKYREQIVSSVYQKAKTMAEIIGKQENISPQIKEVYFAQYISEDIINFNDASLSINAKIEYSFD